MKKIVISLLSSLGLGIDASINSPKEFVTRLRIRGFFNEFKVAYEVNDAKHFTLHIISEIDAVHILYTLDGTRVCDIDVIQG